MQPDRAKPYALKLAGGLFGAPRRAANDVRPLPADAKSEPADRTALDLQHLFGREA